MATIYYKRTTVALIFMALNGNYCIGVLLVMEHLHITITICTAFLQLITVSMYSHIVIFYVVLFYNTGGEWGGNYPLWTLQHHNFQSKLLPGSICGVKTAKIFLEYAK